MERLKTTDYKKDCYSEQSAISEWNEEESEEDDEEDRFSITTTCERKFISLKDNAEIQMQS